MAPVLLGTAAVGGTAATTGLFGTAGAFALAPTLITTGTAVGAIGGLQASRSAATQAEAQAVRVGAQTEAQVTQLRSAQNLALFNAAVQRREAEAVRQRARFEGKRQAKRGARVKSALVAKIAAAGGLGSPVAADLAAEQAAELELENLRIGFEGEVLAGRAESQAELDRIQAKLFGRRAVTQRQIGGLTRQELKQRAKNIKTAGFFGAGETLLTGFGSTKT